MRLLVVLNVDFLYWPLALLGELKKIIPGLKAEAVVVVDQTTSLRAQDNPFFKLEKIHCISQCDQYWGENNHKAEILERAQKFLGPELMNAIALADRELSASYVTGADTPLSPLAKIGLNPNARSSYLANLFEFTEHLFSAGFDGVLSFPVQDAPSAAIAAYAEKIDIPFLQPKALGLGAKYCFFDDLKGMSLCLPRMPTDHTDQHLITFRNQPNIPEYMTVANKTAFELPKFKDLAALLYRALQRRKPGAMRYAYPLHQLAFEIHRSVKLFSDRLYSFEHFSDLQKPFVYFPLHYEPEASTMVACPMMMNQMAVIEALSKSLPSGFELAVKEHVPMLGRRPWGYYDKLKKLPHVRLISPFERSMVGIQKSAVTATITGTAGLEAVLSKKPALFFGPNPIQLLNEGFVRCSDFEKLPEALEKALKIPAVSDAKLQDFLNMIEANSVELKAKDYWGIAEIVSADLVMQNNQQVKKLAELFFAALEKKRGKQ